MDNILDFPNVGPYMGVSNEKYVGRYRIILYGAFNAQGLIGSEHNGIAVLDEQDHTVLLDRHAQINSGYYGAGRTQITEFSRLVALDYEDLEKFIESHPRYRYQ